MKEREIMGRRIWRETEREKEMEKPSVYAATAELVSVDPGCPVSSMDPTDGWNKEESNNSRKQKHMIHDQENTNTRTDRHLRMNSEVLIE